MRDPCSRRKSFGRKIIVLTRYPCNTTKRLPREGAGSRRRRETEGVALGRSDWPRCATFAVRPYGRLPCNGENPGNAEGNSLSLSGVCDDRGQHAADTAAAREPCVERLM